MLRMQNPEVFEQLRQQLDLGGQGAPVLQMDTTVVPVVVVEAPGVVSPVQAGATWGPAAGNVAWFQIRAGDTQALAIDMLILLSTAAANIVYGVHNTPFGTPANSKIVQSIAPPVVTASAVPEWLGGASFLYSEQAVGGINPALYNGGVYHAGGQTSIVTFPRPAILLPGMCLEVVCLNAAVLCGCTFHGAAFVDA